jgi:hypothetical protein
MRSTKRGDVTTFSREGTKMLKLIDIPLVHPDCELPTGEWTNFMKITTVMKDFASSCIPEKDFSGIDVCLFDLSTCLDYGIQMDIRLANASQASMVVIFVPNVNECPVMQKFVAKLSTKKAVPKEGKANQTKKGKRTQQKHHQKKKTCGKMPVCLDENDIDMATNKYLLMLVHAPTHF